MIGTPLDGRGGMSSVVAAYRDGGFFEHCGIRYLSPVTAGGTAKKASVASAVWFQFLFLLVAGHVRLVHVHVASGISFWRKSVFCWLAYLFRRPVILHVHGGNFPEFFARSPAWARRYIRATMLRAWRVVVLSDSWVSKLGAIVPAENCLAMANPVVAWPLPKRMHGEEIRFLFLGRLERDKGIYELLAAFARVCERVPCRLMLGGDGELKPVLALANELGVDSRVDFLGWVTGEAKRRAFGDADIFVLPSHIEGLPVSMLEAMHCGLPIVICPVGSIPEVLCDEQDALFIPPQNAEKLADAMIRLAVDSGLRKRLGTAGQRVFTHRFSADAVLPRLEHLYLAAMENSGSKTRLQGRNG